MSTEKKTTQEEAVEAALNAVFGGDGVPKPGVCVDVIPDGDGRTSARYYSKKVMCDHY